MIKAPTYFSNFENEKLHDRGGNLENNDVMDEWIYLKFIGSDGW